MRQAAPIGTAHRIVLDRTDSGDYDRLVTEAVGLGGGDA
jgi:hypothetical protein